jgi:ribosomal protein S6
MVLMAPQVAEQKDITKDQVEKLLTKVKAEVAMTDDWGEKQMAYTIQGHDKGHYVVYQIEVEPNKQSELITKLKLQKGVLRTLSLVKN